MVTLQETSRTSNSEEIWSSLTFSLISKFQNPRSQILHEHVRRGDFALVRLALFKVSIRLGVSIVSIIPIPENTSANASLKVTEKANSWKHC